MRGAKPRLQGSIPCLPDLLYKIIAMSFKVRKTACSTCIYRKDSPLDLKKLEDDVRDPHMGFKGHRICHHTTEHCCRGFWNRHKDKFPAGQIAQRLNLVEFSDEEVDNLPGANRIIESEEGD